MPFLEDSLSPSKIRGDPLQVQRRALYIQLPLFSFHFPNNRRRLMNSYAERNTQSPTESSYGSSPDAPSDQSPQNSVAEVPSQVNQFRLLAREVQDCSIFLLDEEGTVISWNQSAKQVYGYSEEEIVGSSLSSLYVKDDVDAGIPEQALSTALDDEQWTREGWQIRSDGSTFWARQKITALQNEQGALSGFATVTRDLTEQRERKQKLRRSEQRYRRLFETSQEGIVLTSPAGEILEANPALCRLTGYDCEELIGKQASTLYDEHAREKLVRRLQDQGWVRDLEVPLRRNDGTEIICQVSATLWESEDGEAEAVQSFVRDITEEKQAQMALKESESKFRALAENSIVGILLLQEGKLQYVNEALAQMYGYSRSELIDCSYIEELVHPHDRDRVKKNIDRRLQGEVGSKTFRFKGKTKEGETIHVKAFGRRIDYQGKPAILGTDIDVTKRTRLQREVLRIQEKERRRLGRDLHDVVASQLTGVSIMLDTVAQRKVEDETVSERIQDIRDLVVESCEDIRQLSRGLNPAGLSEDRLPATLERLASNTENCRFESPDFAPSDDIPLDDDVATHLYCIAQEATANARKYAEADDIVIHLTRDGDALLLTIEDDGQGFDPQNLHEDSLGLRTMKYRAELLGAEFSLDSSPGEGTRVQCRLPV